MEANSPFGGAQIEAKVLLLIAKIVCVCVYLIIFGYLFHSPITFTSATKNTADELQARLTSLNDAETNYSDLGPIMDCVVFHDGNTWRAVVDSEESGNLSKYEPLANYS